MHYCQKCGQIMTSVRRGGCGGRGSVYQCNGCNQLYVQSTGGIVSTRGGETFKPIEALWETLGI